MGTRNKQVDAYIARAADFAQPVLVHFRELVHQACPEVEEQIKWGMPYFSYKGLMCGMASFRSHCAIGFWKSSLLPDPERILEKRGTKSAMGQFGRVTSLGDLPGDRVIVAYIKSAAALNEQGSRKPVKTVSRSAKPVRAPAYFRDALRERPAALKAYESFTPSQRRDYIEWLTEAKSAATRQRRLNTALEWIAGGKTRNWKYMKKG